MLAKKTSLRISIISVIIASLFANAVTAQNITQDNHEKYQVTFDFRIVDAFSGEPLNGVLHVHAFVSDELWKESLEMGEWVEDIVVKEFSGGKISFNAPLHGQYGFEIYVDMGESPSPFGDLPHYDWCYRWMVFDGEDEVKARIGVFPVGYVFVKLYSPEGKLMKFKDWDELYRYNLALFFGTYDDLNFTGPYLSEKGELAIKIPAGRPSRIYWMDYVPGYGFVWLIADNDGKGYLLDKGKYIVINLVYESAKTMLRKASAFVESLPSDVPLSENVTRHLNEAQELIKAAESLDERSKALNGWKALEKTLKAWRQAILDYSWYRIRKFRIGRLSLDLPPGIKANITLDYIDFLFYAGINFDDEKLRPYYNELNGFSKYGHLGFYGAMNIDGSIPEEEFRKQYEYVREVMGARQFNTVGGDLAYYPLYESGFTHPSQLLEVSEDLKKLLIPFNITALLKISKRHIVDLFSLVKKYNVNLKTIEVMTEYDKAYYSKPFIWNGYIYFRPLTLEEKAGIAKELNQFIKNLAPSVKITTYFANPSNPFSAFWMKTNLNWEKYERLGTIDAVKYFLRQKGVKADIVGFQVHMLHPWGPLDVVEVYNLLEKLNEILPSSADIGVMEFDVPSRFGAENEEFYGLELAEYVDERFQARLVRDSMIIFLGFPRMKIVGYYFGMDPTSCERQTGYCGLYRGLIRSDYTPKPAYHAVINLFKSLIYEGQCSKELTTLAGWYNVTLYREGGQPIETYRIHVDGGSTTRLIVRFFENETLKVEVERLRSELEAYKSEIDELQKTVNRLQQQSAEKDETIHRLKKELSKHPETITVTITKTLKTTETVVSPSKDTLTLLLIALVAGLAVVTITVAIIALRRRANYVR